jgi:PilZ domain-containing protein
MRRSERFPVNLPVVWSRGGRAISCVARDLNLHGAFICTDEIIEHGSLMQVRFQLPERTIEMFVTARFVGNTFSGHGIGAEIFIIDDESRTAWVRYYQMLDRQAQLEAKQPAQAQLGRFGL